MRRVLVLQRWNLSLVPLALVVVGVSWAACGSDPQLELADIDKQLSSLETEMRGADGPGSAEACVSYASVCERAASLCLWIGPDSPEAPRCADTAARCDSNLQRFCDRPGPGADAGPFPSGDGGELDAGPPPQLDGGELDAGPPPQLDGGGSDGGSGCGAFDARGVGYCRAILGVIWNGQTCEYISGCRCEGQDCGRLYPYGGDDQCEVDHAHCKAGPCYVGGCSQELCTDQPGAISTCEWKREYECYQLHGTCERQPEGGCGWTPTAPLQMCLDGAKSDCRDTGCAEGESCQPCWFTYACLPPGAVC